MTTRSRRAQRLAATRELGDFIDSLRKHEASCNSTWFARHDSREDSALWLVTPVSHNDRSDDALADVNYEVAQELLEAASSFSETAERYDAWPGGIIETLLVRSDDAGAIRELRRITDALRDYPVLSEERLSEREHEDNHPGSGECYATDDDGNYLGDGTPASCCDEALRRQEAAAHRLWPYHPGLVPDEDGEAWCDTCQEYVRAIAAVTYLGDDMTEAELHDTLREMRA